MQTINHKTSKSHRRHTRRDNYKIKWEVRYTATHKEEFNKIKQKTLNE